MQRRWQFADTYTTQPRLAHDQGGRRVPARGRRLRPRRLPRRPRRAGAGLPRSSTPTATARSNDNDLLFAVTLRSGHPDRASQLAELRQQPHGLLRAGRLAGAPRTSRSTSGCATSWTPTSRTSAATARSTRSCSRSCKGDRGRDKNNFGAAHRLQLVHRQRQDAACTAGTASTSTASRSRFRRSSAGSTAARCRSKCAPVTCSSSTRYGPPFLPPFAPSISNPFTGFILPGAGAGGINIIDNTMQNPTVAAVQPRASSSSSAATWRCESTASTRSAPTSSSGGPSASCSTRSSAVPTRVVNLESSVRTKYDALLASRRAAVVARLRAPRVVHALQGVQLRERRPDSVSAAGRSTPTTCSGSTARRRTTSAIASRLPASWNCAGRLQRVDDLDAGLGRADGHPAARRHDAHPGAAAQRRRPTVQDAGRTERLSCGT